jgi:hypothetical protein
MNIHFPRASLIHRSPLGPLVPYSYGSLVTYDLNNVIGPTGPRGKHNISIRVVAEPTTGQYLRETQGKGPLLS